MSRASSGSFDDLVMQAKITNRLLAAQLRDRMNQMDLVKLLSTTGATDREIAEVLDTTPATVSVTKQRIKKKGQKKPQVETNAGN